MKPEISINRSNREESVRNLASHMQDAIKLNDWESFLIFLRAAWEWSSEDKSVQILFEPYFLAECRWMLQQDKFKSFEKYCMKFLFEEVVKSSEDKENAVRSQQDVAIVLKYWFRHLEASHFLTTPFVLQCAKKYFYDVVFLSIRLENAHQALLDSSVNLEVLWANEEDAKLFLKFIMKKVDLIPMWPMLVFLNDFPNHRDLLWYMVSDHSHRFVLFEYMTEYSRAHKLGCEKDVFQRWAEECQKELNPWERALSDKMIFKIADRESLYESKRFVFSLLILIRPGDHAGRVQRPEAISRSDFWPNRCFQWYMPSLASEDFIGYERLSADYLIYMREPAKALTAPLCHEWVLEHLTIRKYLRSVAWDAVKEYEPALAAQLESIDFKEEKGYFFWDCVRKKGGWREWLMSHSVILDHQRLQVLSQLKKLEWTVGMVPDAYLKELGARCMDLHQFLDGIKRDVLSDKTPDLASCQGAYKAMKAHKKSFDYHLKALACLQENNVLLMSTQSSRNSLLEYRWYGVIGYGFHRSALDGVQQAFADNFERYIPPLCLSAIGLPAEKVGALTVPKSNVTEKPGFRSQ